MNQEKVHVVIWGGTYMDRAVIKSYIINEQTRGHIPNLGKVQSFEYAEGAAEAVSDIEQGKG